MFCGQCPSGCCVCGVSKTIKDTGKYAGGPVMTLSEHNRQQVHLRKIGEYVKRLKALEAKLGKET